ncbi:major strawberry allergen Fra a 1.07-like [Macadamia integrifolia]|uniref:major strawberry allergen Fra a 1.07-like n=1 Tax=Macadamia integrifolia TaxID=60698 RepID=UPI001C5300BE|nr:major strawberry allergen Fra a 1.07-like [Macadamia integrifolia]
MGVSTFTEDIKSPIAPARIFKAGVLDARNLLPKLLPDKIKSIEVQGSGGPGTIEQINLAEGSHSKCVKHQIDEIDKENFICKHTVTEGVVIGDKIKKIVETAKFEASPDGGSICKTTSEYHTVDDYKVTEEERKTARDMARRVYKVVEAYLLENPNAYA